MTDLCTVLDWDSAFFRKRIARVTPSRLTTEQTDEVLAWCAAQQVDCLYFLADSDHAETIRAVEGRGFALVDVRIVLEHRGVTPTMPAGIRPHHFEDIAALKAMARVNHRDSRFYYDGHFAAKDCDGLYALWIERSCAGYANVVLVAERDGQPTGYVTCHVTGGSGQIGLLGVGEAWQGQRIGPALIEGALHWFGEHDINAVQVVTQGRNLRAQRAYQRGGFVTAEVQLWYHRWLEPTDT